MKLWHYLTDPILPWQWHADEPWICPYTGKLTSYIAGFATEYEAISYGKREGWTNSTPTKEPTT